MKLVIAALFSLLSTSAIAACLGEAQIIAKVQTNAKSLSRCVAIIDATTIVQYNENTVCPLDISEVLEKGVEVGLQNGHDCRIEAGDFISGVLVKTQAGSIVLE